MTTMPAGFRFCFTLFAAAMIVSGVNGSAIAQTVDADGIYKANCATCHDQPTGRTPSKDALKERTADAILTALTSGSMSMQGLPLSVAERRALAEHLSGKPLGASTGVTSGLCTTKPASIANIAAGSPWNGWGPDATNARYQPKPGLTAADVPNLKLKWAFGFPGGTQAYGNPTIVAGRVFAGSDNGTVYALDADSGCIHWTFKAEGGVRSAPTVGAAGRRVAVYFGDMKANVFAVDATTGELIWKKQVDPHKFARVTGAPTLAGGRLYIPVSSIEEAPAAQPS
jgi:polyvinyl alcohol dehydrogenase (cytochrome)